jgi:hypothetical protein
VIVRENSEGEYAGVGGRAHQGHPIEVATDVSMMTRAGVERIMRLPSGWRSSRPRKLLTVVTKSNAQRHAMVMWDEIALQVSKEFPDVKWDKELVDACTARMVNRPASLDTIVATNLHADILSDLAAALAGSLGIAPTGNIDPERRYPSMFEPIHGSAFDIMGKGLANPVGTFWSCVMLLEHLGERPRRVLMAAIEAVTANPACTPGPGWHGHDTQVTAAVCARLAAALHAPGRLRQRQEHDNPPGDSHEEHDLLCLALGAGAAGPAGTGPGLPRTRTSCTGRPSRRRGVRPVGAPPAGGAEEEVRRHRHHHPVQGRRRRRADVEPDEPAARRRAERGGREPAAHRVPADGRRSPVQDRDITPVFWFHYTPDALVVPEASPYKTFAEFIAAAKKHPAS